MHSHALLSAVIEQPDREAEGVTVVLSELEPESVAFRLSFPLYFDNKLPSVPRKLALQNL